MENGIVIKYNGINNNVIKQFVIVIKLMLNKLILILLIKIIGNKIIIII